jgi:hypothetical protein
MTLPLRVPLAQIEEHPDFRLRFSYEHIDELVQSFIGTAKAEWNAGRGDSNGQQQPGRAILSQDGKTWLLYSGLRRRLAMIKAYETTKDKRFSYFWFYDDTGISRVEMLRRVLDDRQGVRENLTPLEQVRVFRLFKDADVVRLVEKDGKYRRLKELAERLDNRIIEDLRRIEEKTDYTFKLSALEYLITIKDEHERRMTAAEIAALRYDTSRKKMEDAYRFKEEVFSFPWFIELFPYIKPSYNSTEELKQMAKELQMQMSKMIVGGQHAIPTERPGKLSMEQLLEPPASSFQKPLSSQQSSDTVVRRELPAIVSEKTLLFNCPYCGAPAAFEPSKVVFEGHLIPITGKPAIPVAMEALAGEGVVTECEKCGKEYHYQIRLTDGKYYVTTSKGRGSIAKPAGQQAEPVMMVWNDERRCWDVLDKNGNVAGSLSLEEGKRRG